MTHETDMGDTFPTLLLRNADAWPEGPAIREKEFGIWQTWTWTRAADDVRRMAMGLWSLGLRPKENLAIIGSNRPQLYLMYLAVQSISAVPVPIYHDAIADEIDFIIDDVDARVVYAEDQEQVDKLLELRGSQENASGGKLSTIIYEDPRGLGTYQEPGLLSLEQLLVDGGRFDSEQPHQYEELVSRVGSEDVAVILYTSGTTGRPKGVCQTHAAFIASARGGVEVDHLSHSDEIVCYLPPAWAGDFMFSFSQWLAAGYTINCPESPSTVPNDLQEIGPTYYFAPPPIFEGLLTTVAIKMEDAWAFKRWLYRTFMGVAAECGQKLLDGKPVSVGNRLLYWLGNVVIYGPLKNIMGLTRVRVAYTAGAAIGPDLFKFFRSIGINLKQLYGQTETCGYVCIQRDGEVRSDSVGRVAPGMEIHIAPNREVLVKGVSLMKEYYRRPDATAEVFDENGYFLTGDAGILDGKGDLRIIDRAKDVGELAGGAMFAPNYLENKLKFFPQIKEAVCFGHQRDRVCAFINIDLDAVGNWAERRGIPYAGYIDLAGKPEVLSLIRECVERVNEGLAEDGMMNQCQIARFVVLHKELDADDEELTRTKKVRRALVAQKYGVLLDALYSGSSEQYIETAVRFEDGRAGMVSATLQIVDTSYGQATDQPA